MNVSNIIDDKSKQVTGQQVSVTQSPQLFMSGQQTITVSSNPSSTIVAMTSANPSAQNPALASLPQYHIIPTQPVQGSKYNQLLAILEELGTKIFELFWIFKFERKMCKYKCKFIGKDIRPMYTGNRNCHDRLKRGITTAKAMVRECLLENENNARRQQPHQ